MEVIVISSDSDSDSDAIFALLDSDNEITVTLADVSPSILKVCLKPASYPG